MTFMSSIKAMFTPMDDGRIVALERRVQELESRCDLSYEGVWNEARAYRRNHAVTSGGCLWILTADAATGRPGADYRWRLAVKCGRDGRRDRDQEGRARRTGGAA